ncbi:MAG TPA: hypothetical protein VJH92_05305 [Candidatus Nanoarchaeia archaeon]|nr:hypothetical protein [Candidatus Nanoarchaeia archaeon]
MKNSINKVFYTKKHVIISVLNGPVVQWLNAWLAVDGHQGSPSQPFLSRGVRFSTGSWKDI